MAKAFFLHDTIADITLTNLGHESNFGDLPPITKTNPNDGTMLITMMVFHKITGYFSIQGMNTFSETVFNVQFKMSFVLVLLFRIHLVLVISQSDNQIQFKVYLVVDMPMQGVP